MSDWKKFESMGNMSGPRKLMLAAIITQFVTMFINVRDVDSYGVLSISADWSTHGTYWIGDSATTGWGVRPLGPFVLTYLFLMFATKKYEGSFWKVHGYKMAAALMLFFTTGGAPLRVFGGFLSAAAQVVAFVAAYKHGKELKNKPTDPVSATATDATSNSAVPSPPVSNRLVAANKAASKARKNTPKPANPKAKDHTSTEEAAKS